MSSFEAPLDQSAASDTSSSSNNEELRNYHLSIEYKHLQTHSPSGVYLLPHSTLLRSFSGVIFLRRGIYQNAIFKFQVDCGDDYNSPGCSPPKVTFVNPNGGNPYHPLVDSSGALDVKSLVGTWDSKRCFLITLLTFVKKAFYIKEFHRGQGGVEGGAMRCERWANEAAFEAFANNREAFIGFVKESVDKSQEMVYEEVEGGWSFEKQLEGDGMVVRAASKDGVDGILDAIIQMERSAAEPS